METLRFIAGVQVGIAMMEINRRSVKKAVDAERGRGEQLRRENAQLRDDLSAMMQANDCRIARQRGFDAGRKSPLNQAEMLVDSFGGRNVSIRGRRSA